MTGIRRTNALISECPECDNEIQFDKKPEIGQIVVCPTCGEKLEVRQTNPIWLDWAYDEAYDYDYDEDEIEYEDDDYAYDDYDEDEYENDGGDDD